MAMSLRAVKVNEENLRMVFKLRQFHSNAQFCQTRQVCEHELCQNSKESQEDKTEMNLRHKL